MVRSMKKPPAYPVASVTMPSAYATAAAISRRL